MENKNVGNLLLGVSALIIMIIMLFNSALKEIVKESCGKIHGEYCPMIQTINQQTYVALGVVGLLVIVSLVLIFSKPDEKIILKIRTIHEKIKKKKIDTSGFRPEDKKVLRLIQEKGAIFQADLIGETGFGKAKMSRIIDRLEGKGIVERKRRGMTNVVVIKNQ